MNWIRSKNLDINQPSLLWFVSTHKLSPAALLDIKQPSLLWFVSTHKLSPAALFGLNHTGREDGENKNKRNAGFHDDKTQRIE
jgi:hypothetical protein